jgi:hypothetical protein
MERRSLFENVGEWRGDRFLKKEGNWRAIAVGHEKGRRSLFKIGKGRSDHFLK